MKQKRRIDFLLDYLVDAWHGLPRAEREIDGWDLIEQIDYVEEWAPKEALLEELSGHAADGNMSREQLARYERLKQSVAAGRPILQRLRES